MRNRLVARLSPPLCVAAVLAAGAPRAARAISPPGGGPASPGAPSAAAPSVSLDTALRGLSSRTGDVIVAEPALLAAKVPANASSSAAAPVPSGPGDVERALTAITAALPKGTEWLKLMLPPPPPGRTYRAEDLIGLAFAQARLFGTAGEATPAGTVEVLGRRVDGERAAGVVKALDLRPVYVVVNASAASVATMSRDEQKEWGKQQAKELLAADPDARKQMLKQMFQIPMAVMEGLGGMIGGMPKDQQADLIRSLGGTADQNGFNLSFSAKGDDAGK